MPSLLVLMWAVPAALSTVSLATRRPWTVIPARRKQPREFWSMPVFHETNMVITGAWTVYFSLAAVATWAVPSMSLPLGIMTWPLSGLSQRFGTWYSTRRLASQPATP